MSYILLFLLIGMLLKRYIPEPEKIGVKLSQYVIYVAFPAIIVLISLPDILGSEFMKFLAVPWAWMFITVIAMYFIGKKLKWDKDVRLVAMLLTSTGNTGFFGLPLVRELFAADTHFYAVLYDQLVTFFFVSLVVPISILLYKKEVVNASKFITKVVLFPPFLAFLIVLFVVPYYPLPDSMVLVFELIGESIIPVGMLGLGLQLSLKVDKVNVIPLAIAVTWKLIMMPVFIFIGYYLLGVKTHAWQIGVFQSLMPPSLSGFFLLSAAYIAPRFAGSMLIFLICGMFIVVPIYLVIVGVY